MFEKYWEIQRAKAAGERDDSGFTLIELLIVIVVLGILAATVIFALGGVTGQSAVAACNSDAKSYEVAIAAYAAAPSNTSGGTATTTAALIGTAFGGPFLHAASTNPAYNVALSGDAPILNSGTPLLFNSAGLQGTGAGYSAAVPGTVYVQPTAAGGKWVAYDSENNTTASTLVNGGCNNA